MAKETIRFKGLSLNRDEQSAEHGELALCAGVELHDGALRPSVLQGSTVTHKETVGGEEVDVPSTFQVKVSGVDTPVTLLYVHETPAYRHFICSLGGKLYWFKSDGTVGSPLESGSHTPIHDFTSDIISVQSVGNTVVVMALTGVHYILYKEGAYKYLGTQIPFVPIKFKPSANKPGEYDISDIPDAPASLKSQSAWRALSLDPDQVASVGSDAETGKKAVYIKSGNSGSFTEGIWALINQTNNTIAKDGHFYAPFLIRYCYRLYDGSMVMHSAPVYMNISSPRSYRVYFNNAFNWRGDNNIWINDDQITIHDGDATFTVPADTTSFCYEPNNVSILYSTMDSTALNNLKENWSDIVKSIDIFASPMMAREKTGEKITKAKEETGDIGVRGDILRLFKTNRWTRVESVAVVDFDLNIEFDIPLEDEEVYLQRLKDCSTFFKIKSFSIETDAIDTNGAYAELPIDKNAVITLTSQEQMKDDYLTHNRLLPINTNSGMYMYNHRMNLYGMQEILFHGFSLESMLNEYEETDPDLSADYLEQVAVSAVYVEINTEQGKKYVGGLTNINYLFEYSICKSLLFYPDSRASRMLIYYTKNSTQYEMILDLEKSNFLNAAVSSSLFYEIALSGTAAAPHPQTSSTYQLQSKVITSEVDDPYFFPVEGRNSVGNGVIKGVAAVTRALSQGQVGDHDLMVFSTDGIWALKVSSEGTYMAMHNISREVCSNQKSICQLDQSVLFATERNLVQLWESDMRSLSEVLDGPVPDWQHVLPSLYAAFPANGTEAQQVIHRLLEQGTPAVTMFNKGRLFYDHASARVVVLPEDTSHESVAMVYSLRDEAWSTMPIPAIKAVVPGYPSPFVQLGDSTVMILNKPYDYAGCEEVAAVPGLIISRTLTFSDTMDVIRGYTQYGDSTLASTLFIYGSNDQRNWQALGTTSRWFYNYLPGKPFRFFRIAIYLQMKPSEEYQQLEVEVVNKYAKL